MFQDISLKQHILFDSTGLAISEHESVIPKRLYSGVLNVTGSGIGCHTAVIQ